MKNNKDSTSLYDSGCIRGLKTREKINGQVGGNSMSDKNVIYAQVLLLDGKIENWKIGLNKKNSPNEFGAYWKQDRVADYTMETQVFRREETVVPDGWAFNSYVFDVLGVRFVNQYEYADDYKLARAVERTLEEVKREMESLNNILSKV